MAKLISWLSSQWHKHKRVWKLLKRPTRQEFTTVAKVSAVGIILIGLIGFIINIIIGFFL